MAILGEITVGERTSIQDGAIRHTTEQWPTVVGAECVVGSGSVVLNRAWVGAGSVVGAQTMVAEDTSTLPFRSTAPTAATTETICVGSIKEYSYDQSRAPGPARPRAE